MWTSLQILVKLPMMTSTTGWKELTMVQRRMMAMLLLPILSDRADDEVARRTHLFVQKDDRRVHSRLTLSSKWETVKIAW